VSARLDNRFAKPQSSTLAQNINRFGQNGKGSSGNPAQQQ
jgi:hypothetical protein